MNYNNAKLQSISGIICKEDDVRLVKLKTWYLCGYRQHLHGIMNRDCNPVKDFNIFEEKRIASIV